MNNPKTFPDAMHDKLGFYVYHLSDPRDDKIFYIGKGKGNRVFEHVKGDFVGKDNDIMSLKLEKINEIKSDNQEPKYIIHRHGMSEETAFIVESALIDAFPNLTNIVRGHGAGQFGLATPQQIIDAYCAEEMEIDPEHKILAISINKSMNNRDTYDAVRYAWDVSEKRAKKADYILAIYKGVCKGCYVAEKWLPATDSVFDNLRNIEHETMRYGFIGKAADAEIENLYVGKKLPEQWQWKRGAAKPFRYINL